MESKQNLEVIQEAINQLLEEERTYANRLLLSTQGEGNGISVGHHPSHRRGLLFELRSQLESLEQEANVEETTSLSPSRMEEILKELKNIKRQNLITHCLLSAMIVVTLTWQLSQVSLILKIKHVLTSPLESLGGIVKRFLNVQPKVNVQEVMKQASSRITEKVPFETPVLKALQLELPGLDSSEEE